MKVAQKTTKYTATKEELGPDPRISEAENY
jgi:hypothetical protein